jgi:hypothetical protein
MVASAVLDGAETLRVAVVPSVQALAVLLLAAPAPPR